MGHFFFYRSRCRRPPRPDGQRARSLVGAGNGATRVFPTFGVADVLDRLSAVADESYMDALAVDPLAGGCRLSRRRAVSTIDRVRLGGRMCNAAVCPRRFIPYAGVLAGESIRSGLIVFRTLM